MKKTTKQVHAQLTTIYAEDNGSGAYHPTKYFSCKFIQDSVHKS